MEGREQWGISGICTRTNAFQLIQVVSSGLGNT